MQKKEEIQTEETLSDPHWQARPLEYLPPGRVTTPMSGTEGDVRQIFTHKVNLMAFKGDITINTLAVGIVNGTNIRFISVEWGESGSGVRSNRYFFKDDQPDGCYIDYDNRTGLTNRSTVVSPQMMHYFSALAKAVPQASASLNRCVEILARPGPEFAVTSSETLTFLAQHTSTMAAFFAYSPQLLHSNFLEDLHEQDETYLNQFENMIAHELGPISHERYLQIIELIKEHAPSSTSATMAKSYLLTRYNADQRAAHHAEPPEH